MHGHGVAVFTAGTVYYVVVGGGASNGLGVGDEGCSGRGEVFGDVKAYGGRIVGEIVVDGGDGGWSLGELVGG